MTVLLKVFMRIILFFFYVFLLTESFCQTKQSLFNPSKNLSKIGVQEIFNGDFSLYQERVFTDKLSAEVGLGIVLRNFIKDFFQENTPSDTRKTLLGPSFSLKAKYYPYIPGEAFYFSAEHKFRRYRTQYSTTSVSGSMFEFNEFSQRNVFRIGIGYIHCVDEHFFIDYYTSVGMSNVLDQNRIPIYNQTTGEYDYEKDKSRTTALHFVAGLKFGYRF